MKNLSLFVLFLLLIFLFIYRLQFPNWDPHLHEGAVLSWDVFGYYLYLPAKFIYHDLWNLNFTKTIMEVYHPTDAYYQSFNNPFGGQVMKYSIGMSMMYFPFFLVGHLTAGWFGYAKDGFTVPYQFSIVIGSYTYTIIGLFFLRAVLKKYFKDGVVALLLLTVILATNFLVYSTYSNQMTHNYCFMFYALLLYYTHQWHIDFKTKHAVVIGFCIGMLTVIRPSEMIAVIIPLLWGIRDRNTLYAKLRLIYTYRLQLVCLLITGLICVSPQLAYWKHTTGKFLYFSYPNEGFDFLHPHLYGAMLSFRKGWLLYTPIMAFAISGFIFLYRQHRETFYSVFIFSLINIWVVSSWSTWWYGGSFGNRAMVQSYAVWMLPLGELFVWLNRRNILIKTASVIFFFMLTTLNLFQHWQLNKGILVADLITKEFYLKTFLKTKSDENDVSLLIPPQNYVDESLPFVNNSHSKTIITENYESISDIISIRQVKNTHAYYNPEAEFIPGFAFFKPQLSDKKQFWIKFSADILLFEEIGKIKLVTTIERSREIYKYKEREITLRNTPSQKWNSVSIENEIIQRVNERDMIKCFVWNIEKEKVAVDNLKLEVIEAGY